MITTPIIGLLDSGIDPALASDAWPRRSFSLAKDAEVHECNDGAPDAIGHGTALARIILQAVPEAHLAIARIFTDKFACTPAAAAAGLDWLAAQGVGLVNMSFGLREDRTVLREACERAAAQGMILLGAAPARGPGVYPSSYDGVIRISGDARLGPGEMSALASRQADFGACPRPAEAERNSRLVGGASFAVAHATAVSLGFLGRNPHAGPADLREYLSSIARFHGPERRKADASPNEVREGDSPCSP